MILTIDYLLADKTYRLSGDIDEKISEQDDNLAYLVDVTDNRITLKLYPKKKLIIQEVSLRNPFVLEEDDRIFFNGYQDWTYSYESDKNTKNPGINEVPFKSFTLKKYHFDRYGDYNFAEYPNIEGYNHGWSYLYVRNNDDYKLLGSLNENFCFTRFVYDHDQLIIIPDLKGYECYDSFVALDFCILNGKEDEVFDKYFEMLKIDKQGTGTGANPITGYTSWYNHYQNITEKKLLNDLSGLSDVDVFQIDDGYQTYVGDWLNINTNKFPNGLENIVNTIHDKGFKAGIWLAPFSAEKKSDIYKSHKDWLVKDEAGNPYACGCNWSTFYALDIYKVEVRQYLKQVFDTVFNKWGFDLVKLDFLYSACVLNRKDKPRGLIMADGMNLLRQLCTDKLILGCGVPLASAFGKVDYCRVGCDVSLKYDDVFYMKHMHNERNSTKRTMVDTIFRRQLDGRAFLNDPDVFILRDKNVSLTKEEKEKLAIINGLFGSLLFTSDDIGKYDEYKLSLYNKIKNLKGKAKAITLNNNVVCVKYEDGEVRIEL